MADRLLQQDERLWLSRSWTTRARRPWERDDAYVFVDRDAFEERIAAGGFLEHAEFLGNLYGTPVPEPPPGRDVLLEIDVQGAAQVLRLDPDALLVFLLPPSAEEHERRLRGRGDPDDVVRRRLAHAADEEARARDLGATLLVNDDLDTTVATLQSLLAQARANKPT